MLSLARSIQERNNSVHSLTVPEQTSDRPATPSILQNGHSFERRRRQIQPEEADLLHVVSDMIAGAVCGWMCTMLFVWLHRCPKASESFATGETPEETPGNAIEGANEGASDTSQAPREVP